MDLEATLKDNDRLTEFWLQVNISPYSHIKNIDCLLPPLTSSSEDSVLLQNKKNHLNVVKRVEL